MMVPVWTEWWLRPVRRAARVGEHRAVVWNWLYLSPFLARLSKVGVLTGPPKGPDAPKPTSSSNTSKTFGAPAGAWSGWVKSGLESLTSIVIAPLNDCGGGSTSGVSPDLGWVVVCCALALISSPPSVAHTATSTAIVRVIVFCIAS